MIQLITKLGPNVISLDIESSNGRIDLSTAPQNTELKLFRQSFKVREEAPIEAYCLAPNEDEDGFRKIRAGYTRLALHDSSGQLVFEGGDWQDFVKELWPHMKTDDSHVRALRLGQDGLMLEVADGDSYRLLRLRPDLESAAGYTRVWERIEDRLAISGLGSEIPIDDEHKAVKKLVNKVLRIDEPSSLTELLFLIYKQDGIFKRRRALHPAFSMNLGGAVWRPRWSLDDGEIVELTDAIPAAPPESMIGAGADPGLNSGKAVEQAGAFKTAGSKQPCQPGQPVEVTFSGDNPVDMEFKLSYEKPSGESGIATRFKLEPIADLRLSTSGTATGGAENRPYFWHFTGVRNISEPYPSTYVCYRLDAAEGPRPDPLAEQQAGLSGPMVMPLVMFDAEKTWLLRLGLRDWADTANPTGPRIQLTIEKTGSQDEELKLKLRGGHIIAESPPLRLHCRPLRRAQHPPQETDIRATTCTGRLKFLAVITDETRRAIEVNLKPDNDKVVRLKAVGPDPDTVRVLLPCPMAGIDATAWSDNLAAAGAIARDDSATTPEDENDKDRTKSPMRLHEGVRAVVVSAGGTFDWTVSDKGEFGEFRFHQDSFLDRGPVAGEVFPIRLPWSILSFKESRWRLEPRIRNQIQQRAEADAAAKDQFEAPSELPTAALQDANRALRDLRGTLTSEPFDLAAPGLLDLTGFIPGALFHDKESVLIEPKVRLSPSVHSKHHPSLTVAPWREQSETSELSLDNPDARMVPGRFRWHQDKDLKPILKYAPSDGAAAHTEQFAPPLLFRHPGILSIDALMVGEAPCGLFVTSDNRLIKWMPTVRPEPKELKELNNIDEDTLRLVSIVPKLDRSGKRIDDLAVTTDKFIYWYNQVAPNKDKTDLEIKSFHKKFPITEGWSIEHQQFGDLPEDLFLLLLEKNGDHRQLRFLRRTDTPETNGRLLKNPPAGLKNFAYSSIGNNALLVLTIDSTQLSDEEMDRLPLSVGDGSNFFEVRLWWGNSTLGSDPQDDPPDPTCTQNLGLSLPSDSPLPYENAVLGSPKVWWESEEDFWIVATLSDKDKPDAPRLLAWKCSVIEESEVINGETKEITKIDSDVEPIAADRLAAHFGGVPNVIAIGPQIADPIYHKPLHAVLFGPAAGDSDRDRYLRLTQPPFGAPGLTTDPAPGQLVCRGVGSAVMVGEVIENKDKNDESDWSRKFSALGGCFAFTGGDDGVMRLWDVVGGEVLHEYALADQTLDNDGVIRPIDNGLVEVDIIEGDEWRVDPMRLWMRRNEPTPDWQPCIALTRIGKPEELSESNCGVRLCANALKLVPKNSTDQNKTWIPISKLQPAGHAKKAVPILDPGEFRIEVFSESGKEDAILLENLLGNLEIEEFTFKNEPDTVKISTVDIQEVVLKAVLGNPCIKDKDRNRQQADMDDADVDGIQVKLEFNRGRDEGERLTITGKFRWRFSVAEQTATAFFLPALISRLGVIEGSVEGNAEKLTFTLDHDKSLVHLMGRLRPLSKAANDKVYHLVLDAKNPSMIREDLKRIDESLVKSAHLSVGDPRLPVFISGSRNSGPAAAQLLPAMDRLVAMAAEPHRLTLHDAETGALERRLDDAVCCITIMPPATGMQGVKHALETLVSRRDGSANLLALLHPNNSNDITAVTEADLIVRGRFHFGTEPEEVQCAAVTLVESDETDRIILMRGADGIAQLWSTNEGRQLDEIRLADADVTAIALLTEAPGKTMGRMLAKAGYSESDKQVKKRFIVAVGSSDGISRFFACLRDKNGLTRSPLKTLHDTFPVTSLSLAPKIKEKETADNPIFVLSCFGRGGSPRLRDLETAEDVKENIFSKNDDLQFFPGEVERGRLHLLVNRQLIAVLKSPARLHSVSIELTQLEPPSIDIKVVKKEDGQGEFESSIVNLGTESHLLLTWIDNDNQAGSMLINKKNNHKSIQFQSESRLVAAASIGDPVGIFMLLIPADPEKPTLSVHTLSIDSDPKWIAQKIEALAGSMSADWPLAAATSCNIPLFGVLAKGEDDQMVFWEPRDGSIRSLPADYDDGIFACAYLKDALCLAAAEGTRLRIIPADNGRILRELMTELPIRRIHFVESGDEAILLVRSDDGDPQTERQAYQFWTLSEYSLAPIEIPKMNSENDESLIDRWLVQWAGTTRLATASWLTSTTPGKVIVLLSSISGDAPQSEDIRFEVELTEKPMDIRIDTVRVETTDYLLLQTPEASEYRTIIFSSTAAVPAIFNKKLSGSPALDPGILDGKPRLSWGGDDGRLKNIDLFQPDAGEMVHTIPDTFGPLTEHRMIPTDAGPALLARKSTNKEGWMLFCRNQNNPTEWRPVRNLPLQGKLVRRRIPAIAALSESNDGKAIATVWDRTMGRTLGRIPMPPIESDGQKKRWVGLLATEESLYAVHETKVHRFVLGVAGGTSKEGTEVTINPEDGELIRDAAMADHSETGTLILATNINVRKVTGSQSVNVFKDPVIAKRIATLPREDGTVLVAAITDEGNLLHKKLDASDHQKIDGNFHAVAIGNAACIGEPLIVAATGNELLAYESGDPDLNRIRRLKLNNSSCRFSVLDTPDGPRILVGASSDGSGNVHWQILTLKGLLRIRKGQAPVYDLGVRLGTGGWIEARATPGRRVEILFLPPKNLVDRPSWMPQESRMQAFAATVGRGFYAFRLQRLDERHQRGDEKHQRGASGALVIWPATDSEQIDGQFLLEERDPKRKALVSIDGESDPMELSGPNLLLTAGRFNIFPKKMSLKPTEQRFSWYLTGKDDTPPRLLFLDQAPGRCMGHVAFEDKNRHCHGSLSWLVTLDPAKISLDKDGMHLLLPEKSPEQGGPMVEENHDLLLRKESPEQSDPMVEESHDLLLPRSLSQGALSIPLTRLHPDQTKPPQIVVWKMFEGAPRLHLASANQPIDFSNDSDLSYPLSPLGVNAPALIHASSLARALRQDTAGMASFKIKNTEAFKVLDDLEKKNQFVIVPVLEKGKELQAPMTPIAMEAAEPHLQGGYLTENLFVFSRDGDETFPRCVSSATGRIEEGAAGSFFDAADLVRQANRLSNGNILLQRSLRDNGALRYSFFGSRSRINTNVGMPTADSKTDAVQERTGTSIRLTNRDVRNSLRPMPYRRSPSDADAGSRRMTLGFKMSGHLQHKQTDLIYLDLRADSALGNASESRLTTIPTRLAAIKDGDDNLRSFIPSLIELQRGPAKPGALWNLHMRSCSCLLDGASNITAAPWMDLTLREPEPPAPPIGADVEIQTAEFSLDNDQKSETLLLQWIERIGELPTPGGGSNAKAPPVDNIADANTDPKPSINSAQLQKRIAISQRFEESILALDAAAPMGFIPEKGSEGALDLYLVTTFDLSKPLTFKLGDPEQEVSLHAHLLLIPGGVPDEDSANEDSANIVTLKLTEEVIKKLFDPDDVSPFFVFHGSSAFWKAAGSESNGQWDKIGANGKLDLVWIPEDEQVDSNDKIKDLLESLSMFGGKGAPLRTFRPSSILSNLALVEIYEKEDGSVAHERTLAFGSAAVTNGAHVHWDGPADKQSLVISARGNFEQTIPLLECDGSVLPNWLCAIKYYAHGSIKASELITPKRKPQTPNPITVC